MRVTLTLVEYNTKKQQEATDFLSTYTVSTGAVADTIPSFHLPGPCFVLSTLETLICTIFITRTIYRLLSSFHRRMPAKLRSRD